MRRGGPGGRRPPRASTCPRPAAGMPALDGRQTARRSDRSDAMEIHEKAPAVARARPDRADESVWRLPPREVAHLEARRAVDGLHGSLAPGTLFVWKGSRHDQLDAAGGRSSGDLVDGLDHGHQGDRNVPVRAARRRTFVAKRSRGRAWSCACSPVAAAHAAELARVGPRRPEGRGRAPRRGERPATRSGAPGFVGRRTGGAPRPVAAVRSDGARPVRAPAASRCGGCLSVAPAANRVRRLPVARRRRAARARPARARSSPRRGR